MLGMRQKIFIGLSCVHSINLIIQTVSFVSYIYPVLLPPQPYYLTEDHFCIIIYGFVIKSRPGGGGGMPKRMSLLSPHR